MVPYVKWPRVCARQVKSERNIPPSRCFKVLIVSISLRLRLVTTVRLDKHLRCIQVAQARCGGGGRERRMCSTKCCCRRRRRRSRPLFLCLLHTICGFSCALVIAPPWQPTTSADLQCHRCELTMRLTCQSEHTQSCRLPRVLHARYKHATPETRPGTSMQHPSSNYGRPSSFCHCTLGCCASSASA